MKMKRREFTRLFAKGTRAFPILLIIGGMVLSFAGQPLPVVGMSSDRADHATELAKSSEFWTSGEASAVQAKEGYGLTFIDPGGDTPVCLPDPTTLEATVQVTLPEGVEARLQVNWYVVKPEDRRTDIEYEEAGLVTDGDTHTWEAQWPGIRPADDIVEILFGAALIDPETAEIYATETLDIYWYPWVCPVVADPTATPTESLVPPDSDTPTPTITETALTPNPDAATPTVTNTSVPPVVVPANTSTPYVVTATPIIVPGPVITATPIVQIPPPIQATPVVIIPPPIYATPVVIIPPPIQATPVVIIPPPIQATPVVMVPAPIQATAVMIIPPPIQATPQVIIPPPIRATAIMIIPPPIQATPVVIVPEPIQATPVVIVPEPIVATPVVIIPEPVQATPIVMSQAVITATPVVVAPQQIPVTGLQEPPVDKPLIVATLEVPVVLGAEEFIPVTGADLTHLNAQPALEDADWKVAMNLVMSIVGLLSMLVGVIYLFSPNRQ